MLRSLAAFALLGACSGSTESVSSQDEVWRFATSFDEASSFEGLFPPDGTGWTNVQLVEPDGAHATVRSELEFRSGNNRIVLDSERVVTGRHSIRFEAPPTGSSVSKASLVKEGIDFRPSDRIVFRCRLFLDSSATSENTFLVDFESTQVPGFPGRRLAISTDQALMLESKGTGGPYGSGPNVSQVPGVRVPLPKGRWVALRLELRLDRGDQGQVDLWQDGVLLLHATCRTFPIEPEITAFDWIEVGLTANSSGASQRLWIDDVEISRL